MPDAEPSPPLTTEARRDGADRRRQPTRMFSRYLFRGRRRGGRRAGETDRIYVDRPGPWIVAAFFALITLSLADAGFTLHVLTHGGTEANPVMQVALELGNAAFIVLKTIVTMLGAAFLCLHKNWAFGRKCLVAALIGYTLLTAYHLYNVLVVIPSHYV